MSVALTILRFPAVLGLLLALLVSTGCGQATARQSVVDPAPVSAQVAVEQQAEVITEPALAEPAAEKSATAPQPLLFADERPEPYQPRGPPGLVVLPFFPAPLILPFDVRMPSEIGIVVDRVIGGHHVVAWAAISPVGWRVGAVRTVGFRYYDPVIGRYISRDPLGYPNGLNNYLYVGNNPINRTDPLGLIWPFDGELSAAYHGAADWLQSKGEVAHEYYDRTFADSPLTSTALKTLADLGGGAGDVLRLGDGTGEAIRQAQDGAPLLSKEVLGNVLKDAGRAGSVVLTVTGTTGTGRVPRAPAPSPESVPGPKAPTNVTPGVRSVDGVYDPPTRSAPEPYRAHYDQYGRQTGRTDYTGQPDPAVHPNPHHHTYEFGKGHGPNGTDSGPLPGPHPLDVGLPPPGPPPPGAAPGPGGVAPAPPPPQNSDERA